MSGTTQGRRKWHKALRVPYVEEIFGEQNYLELVEMLGSGVCTEFDEHGMVVSPLPRYRRRAQDGRHEA